MSEPGADGDDALLFARLDFAITAALGPLTKGAREIALLFSGGVDSSLLAWELRNVPGLTLGTMGLAGSPDLASARSAARALGLPWSPTIVSVEEVRAAARAIGPETAGTGPVGRSVLTAIALALERALPGTVVCGQGADEMFLGYAHFRGLGAEDAARRSEEDLRRLTEEDWPRSQRIARRWGRLIEAPYLHPEFVGAARATPIERRLPGSLTKEFFRAWARHRGLPQELTQRPKRALQYGSGIDRALRRRT